MTARELTDLLDKKATLAVIHGTTSTVADTLYINVTILNARENFGRIDVLVTPEAGEGQAWVSADRVKVRGQ